RVPARRPGMDVATRVEYRAPDSGCNPYLAFAAVLAAGMAGIEGEYPLPVSAEMSAQTSPERLSEDERRARGVQSLPASLGEAIDAFEGSTLMREALGDHVFETLVANKKLEWAEYRRQVTQYEIDRYLPML